MLLPRQLTSLITRPWLSQSARGLWTATLLGFFALSVCGGWQMARDPMYGNFAPKPLALTNRRDPRLRSLLSYRQPSPEVVTLAGHYEGRRLQVRLRKRDMKELQLVSRGFHWISERPYNR